MVSLFQIHLCTTSLWGLYSIVPSPDLTSVFLSTRSANSCILQPQLIGKLLRGFFAISIVQFLMAFLFNHLLISLSLVILMLIGLTTKMIEKVQVATIVSLALSPNLISRSYTKQKVVSHSSVEFEYRGLANVASELLWIETFLIELHILFFTPPVLFCDTLSATHLAAHPILNAHTKHIEIDYHFIRDCVLHKPLLVKFTPSEEQLTDILTKPLPTPCFQSLRNKLTVLHNPLRLRGDVKQCN